MCNFATWWEHLSWSQATLALIFGAAAFKIAYAVYKIRRMYRGQIQSR